MNRRILGQILAPLLAAAVAIIVSSIALLIADESPITAFEAMWSNIDGTGAIVLIVIFVLFSKDVVHYDYNSFGSGYTTRTSRDLTGFGFALFLGFAVLYNVGVFILQRGLTGRTLGTIAMGLVTVNERGEPLGQFDGKRSRMTAASRSAADVGPDGPPPRLHLALG